MSQHTLCYCTPSLGTKTRLGHVHGAKLSPKEWAKGIIAMAALAGDSRAPWLDKLPKAEKQARRIIGRAK